MITTQDWHRTSWIRRSVGLSVATALALAACGGTSSPKATDTGSAVPTTAAAPQPQPSGQSVALSANGYLYQVAMNPPGVTSATNTTTNDGSGGGGRAIDATPGHTLLLATMSVTNKTDRPEPMPFLASDPLPSTGATSAFNLVVPQSQAAAFGQANQQDCGVSPAQGPNLAPVGYCTLNAAIVAFTPAQTDITQPPQLAPGASGSVTLVVQDNRVGRCPGGSAGQSGQDGRAKVRRRLEHVDHPPLSPRDQPQWPGESARPLRRAGDAPGRGRPGPGRCGYLYPLGQRG